MSIDINWETLTSGPDGAALAETIRDFIHERFQSIPLPRLLRSVGVTSFEFGKTAPEIVLKDICDPLPDFYESDDDDEDDDDDNDNDNDDDVEARDALGDENVESPRSSRVKQQQQKTPKIPKPETFLRHASQFSNPHPSNTPSHHLTRGTGPGILGASNLGYFHLPLSAGISGTQTPLAAVAGAHFGNNNHSNSGNSHAPAGAAATTGQGQQYQHHHAESFGSVSSPPSTATLGSSQRGGKSQQQPQAHAGSSVLEEEDDAEGLGGPPRRSQHESSPEDLQVVFHVTYAGDVRLSLTAEVFLDYPMPSFIGIPLKLKITGITFNGVGIVAYIKRRAHVCFLGPEDAEALVGGDAGIDPLDGSDDDDDDDGQQRSHSAKPRASKPGALLEDIRIESEMGETDTGKQVLKNVGKIEKFVLEQVQRIFEDEFVYPSFWTFLV